MQCETYLSSPLASVSVPDRSHRFFWTEPATSRLFLNLQSGTFNFSSVPASEQSFLDIYISVLAWKITNWAIFPTPKVFGFHWNCSRRKERLPNPKELKLSNYNFLSHHLLVQDHFSTKLFIFHLMTNHKNVKCPFDCKCGYNESRKIPTLKDNVWVLSTVGLFKFVGLSSRLIRTDPSINYLQLPRLSSAHWPPIKSKVWLIFEANSSNSTSFCFQSRVGCEAVHFISSNCFRVNVGFISPAIDLSSLLTYFVINRSFFRSLFSHEPILLLQYFHWARCFYYIHSFEYFSVSVFSKEKFHKFSNNCRSALTSRSVFHFPK